MSSLESMRLLFIRLSEHALANGMPDLCEVYQLSAIRIGEELIMQNIIRRLRDG